MPVTHSDILSGYFRSRVDRVPDLDTRFNDTAVGVLKSLRCISPATFIEKDKVVLLETCLAELKIFCHFYSEDLSGDDDVKREYRNIHGCSKGY